MSVATPYASTTGRILTAEDLWQMGFDVSGELVRGRFIAMSPTGYPHGSIEANIARLVGNFVHRQRLGKVLTGEVGIITKRNPDTVRGADVAFISNQRLAKAKPDGYLDVAPELVVEVISPGDRWTAINEKIEEYFSGGVIEVWVADPGKQRISCYRTPTDVAIFGIDDLITGRAILPGLLLSIREIFDD